MEEEDERKECLRLLRCHPTTLLQRQETLGGEASDAKEETCHMCREEIAHRERRADRERGTEPLVDAPGEHDELASDDIGTRGFPTDDAVEAPLQGEELHEGGQITVGAWVVHTRGEHADPVHGQTFIQQLVQRFKLLLAAVEQLRGEDHVEFLPTQGSLAVGDGAGAELAEEGTRPIPLQESRLHEAFQIRFGLQSRVTGRSASHYSGQ